MRQTKTQYLLLLLVINFLLGIKGTKSQDLSYKNIENTAAEFIDINKVWTPPTYAVAVVEPKLSPTPLSANRLTKLKNQPSQKLTLLLGQLIAQNDHLEQRKNHIITKAGVSLAVFDIILIFCAILCGGLWFRYKTKLEQQKANLQKLLQQVEEYEGMVQRLKSIHEKSHAKKTSYTQNYFEIKNDINDIKGLIEKVSNKQYEGSIDKAIFDLHNRYSQVQNQQFLEWDYFENLFKEFYPNYQKVLNHLGVKSEKLVKNVLCMKMNFSIPESAILIDTTPSAVKQARFRLRKELVQGASGVALKNYIDELDFSQMITN